MGQIQSSVKVKSIPWQWYQLLEVAPLSGLQPCKIIIDKFIISIEVLLFKLDGKPAS